LPGNVADALITTSLGSVSSILAAGAGPKQEVLLPPLITTAAGSVSSILANWQDQNRAAFSYPLITTAIGWAPSGSAPGQDPKRPTPSAETFTHESISHPLHDPEMVKLLATCGRRHEERDLERPTNAEIRRMARIDETTFSKLLNSRIGKRTKKGYFTVPYLNLRRVCLHDEPIAPEPNKRKRAAPKEL